MDRLSHYFLLFAGLFAASICRGQTKVDTLLSKVHARMDTTSSKAQEGMDSIYSEVRVADFHPSSPAIDSNANVIVLRDSGSADLQGTFEGWQVMQIRYHRILIRNKNGFDAAKVEISYDLGMNLFGIHLHAYTCNLVGNQVVRTAVDTSEIFTELTSSGRIKERISFPNVKEGSIIEYGYRVYSHSIYNFIPWNFQGDYPCLKSTYRLSFPELLNYVVSKQGDLPFSRIFAEWDTSYEYGMKMFRTKCYATQWEMDNVPAFRAEPYISAPDDYVAGLRFQLSEFTDLPRTKTIKVNDTWDEVNKELYKSKSFGGVMTATSHWLRKEMRTIVNDTASGIEKARALYAYVRDHFTNTGRAVIVDEDQSLKDLFKSHKGSVAEINLLLTAMLREEGLTADAVILSTRDNGVINPHYPILENLNYVVVRLRVGDDTWYLDASEPRMGFGHLPKDCYNGYARVVSERPDSVNLDADSLRESKVAMLTLANNERGDSLVGAYSAERGYYTSTGIRDEIVEKGEQAYFDAERKTYPFAVQLTEQHVDSLREYDLPVIERYTLGFPIGDDDRIYFNPMLGEGLKQNMFAAAERHYPIEMPYRLDETFVLRMEIPKGYEVEEMPKSTRIRLGDGDGMYEYIFQTGEQSIQFRSRLRVNRTFFSAEAYQPLRNFFTDVVKKQGEMIVFKKK